MSYLKSQATASCFTPGVPYQHPGAAATAWSGGFDGFDAIGTRVAAHAPPGEAWMGGAPHAYPDSSGMHQQQQQQRHNLNQQHGAGGALTVWDDDMYAATVAGTAAATLGVEERKGSVAGEDSGADGDSDGGMGGAGGGGSSVRACFASIGLGVAGLGWVGLVCCPVALYNVVSCCVV